MPIIRLLIFCTLFSFIPDEISKDNTTFISPVRIPLALSANFGELRIDHFHSGIDIKTQGVTGKEVVAPADGYVYRISVTPGGFGNALYLRHASGYSTVYGHLERFIPAIQDYVVNQQYEKKNFTVNLYPPRDKFTFRQGELIAYSGNSGGSTGPHLHYEVRKSENENPVNPLLFDFGTGDDINPVLEKVFIYPVGKNSSVNGERRIKRINVSGGHGNYYFAEGEEIKISGIAGFGIKAYDLLNDSYNKCSAYSIELKIDSTTVYKYVMDEFSYSESRYINSHIDYETYIREKTYIERAYILPNDKLSTYKSSINRGLVHFSENRNYNVKFIVSDIHNNKSVLSFTIKGDSASYHQNTKAPDNLSAVMPYNRSNRFRSEGLSLTIPAGALYDTLFFEYRHNKGNDDMLSEVHYIHNKYTPLQRSYSLSIKPSVIPAGKESKLLLVQMSDDYRKSAVSSTYTEGYVTGDPLSFGMFFVGIDTVGPGIYVNNLTDGIDLSERKEMRIRIEDDLSGIKSYEPLIDGKWALFEYDQKNSTIIYRFDPKRISKGTSHRLVLKVTDNKDNASFLNMGFKW